MNKNALLIVIGISLSRSWQMMKMRTTGEQQENIISMHVVVVVVVW